MYDRLMLLSKIAWNKSSNIKEGKGPALGQY
jgi:hypothetical protein